MSSRQEDGERAQSERDVSPTFGAGHCFKGTH